MSFSHSEKRFDKNCSTNYWAEQNHWKLILTKMLPLSWIATKIPRTDYSTATSGLLTVCITKPSALFFASFCLKLYFVCPNRIFFTSVNAWAYTPQRFLQPMASLMADIGIHVSVATTSDPTIRRDQYVNVSYPLQQQFSSAWRSTRLFELTGNDRGFSLGFRNPHHRCTRFRSEYKPQPNAIFPVSFPETKGACQVTASLGTFF